MGIRRKQRRLAKSELALHKAIRSELRKADGRMRATLKVYRKLSYARWAIRGRSC